MNDIFVWLKKIMRAADGNHDSLFPWPNAVGLKNLFTHYHMRSKHPS